MPSASLRYRLLRIARGDQTPLAGFDENAWAVTAPHAHRVIREIADEMSAVRAASLALYRSLDATAIAHQGTANNAAGHGAGAHVDPRRPRASITWISCASATGSRSK